MLRVTIRQHNFILAQILEENASPCKVSITGYHYWYLRRYQFYRFQDDIVSPWIGKELDYETSWRQLFAIRDVTNIANMHANGFRHLLYFVIYFSYIFSAFKQ